MEIFDKKTGTFVSPLDVAKKLGVEEQYLNLLMEEELNENVIESEIEKTKEDFLNSELKKIA